LGVAATAWSSAASQRDRSVPWGEVLAEQAVGVPAGAALPGAVGVGEADLEAGADAEPDLLGLLGQFRAAIPGQRPAQLLGQRGDRGGDRVPHGFGATARRRGSFGAGQFGQLAGTGDVVSMGVGFHRPQQFEAVLAQRRQIALNLYIHRIDDEGFARGLVKQ